MILDTDTDSIDRKASLVCVWFVCGARPERGGQVPGMAVKRWDGAFDRARCSIGVRYENGWFSKLIEDYLECRRQISNRWSINALRV